MYTRYINPKENNTKKIPATTSNALKDEPKNLVSGLYMMMNKPLNKESNSTKFIKIALPK